MTETTAATPKPNRRKWLWLSIFLVLVVLAALPFVVGTFLPDTYTGEVRLTVNRPPADVWKRLTDFQKYPLSGAMCKAAEPLPDEQEQPAWTEDINESILTITTQELSEGKRLKRHLRDSVVPMTADWEIEITPIEGGSRVVARHTTVIRHGTWHTPLFRILVGSMGGATEGMKDYLKRVADGTGGEVKLE